MKHAPDCKIIVGDCLESLRALSAESVHCVVTSPPYYGLRDYGIRETEWPEVEFSPMSGLPTVKIAAQTCSLGLEKDPWSFIAHMVLVFREVRRVLRADGTLWMNMGDSYAGNPGGGQGAGGQMVGRAVAKAREDAKARVSAMLDRKANFKNKDLMGMPWRVAMALQADGWWLRQDIIWHKPNPMPESVHDRCCKAHEYIFLLSKSARYFYDTEAVKEPVSGTANPLGSGVNKKIKMPDGWATHKGGHGSFHKEEREKGKTRPKQNASFSAAVKDLVSTRHKRSVWTITTEACREAHFATFPTELVKPCILAGTSAGGCCPECGAPYLRQIEKGEPDIEHQRACGGDVNGEYHGTATKDFKAARAEDASEVKARILRGMVKSKTTGWLPSCTCDAGRPVPCVVLDNFFGSGTTGLVAMENGRSAIGLEINPDYAGIAHRRTSNITPSLALPL